MFSCAGWVASVWDAFTYFLLTLLLLTVQDAAPAVAQVISCSLAFASACMMVQSRVSSLLLDDRDIIHRRVLFPDRRIPYADIKLVTYRHPEYWDRDGVWVLSSADDVLADLSSFWSVELAEALPRKGVVVQRSERWLRHWTCGGLFHHPLALALLWTLIYNVVRLC